MCATLTFGQNTENGHHVVPGFRWRLRKHHSVFFCNEKRHRSLVLVTFCESFLWSAPGERTTVCIRPQNDFWPVGQSEEKRFRSESSRFFVSKCFFLPENWLLQVCKPCTEHLNNLLAYLFPSLNEICLCCARSILFPTRKKAASSSTLPCVRTKLRQNSAFAKDFSLVMS